MASFLQNGQIPDEAKKLIEKYLPGGLEEFRTTPKTSETMKRDPKDPYSFVSDHRRLKISQKYENFESLLNFLGCFSFEGKNSYEVFDEAGKKMLSVREDSNIFCRWCCKPNHSSVMQADWILDKRRAMNIEKPCRLNCFPCVPCFQPAQKSYLGVNKKQSIGSAKKVCTLKCFNPKFELKDEHNKTYGYVYGPCCITGGLRELVYDIPFYAYDLKGNVVAEILKLKPNCGFNTWKPEQFKKALLCDIESLELVKEFTGDADDYSLTFFQSFQSDADDTESKMTEQHKANLLATIFLIDYVFFEAGPPFTFRNPKDKTCNVNCFTCNVCGYVVSCGDCFCLNFWLWCLFFKKMNKIDHMREKASRQIAKREELFPKNK